MINADDFSFWNFTKFYPVTFCSAADDSLVVTDMDLLFSVFTIQIFAEFISWFGTLYAGIQLTVSFENSPIFSI